jgi:hypothetical protein
MTGTENEVLAKIPISADTEINYGQDVNLYG